MSFHRFACAALLALGLCHPVGAVLGWRSLRAIGHHSLISPAPDPFTTPRFASDKTVLISCWRPGAGNEPVDFYYTAKLRRDLRVPHRYNVFYRNLGRDSRFGIFPREAWRAELCSPASPFVAASACAGPVEKFRLRLINPGLADQEEWFECGR